MDFKKALSVAKVQLMMAPQTAFVSSVMLALNLREDDSVPTACTDGLDIKFNPSFFLGLTSKVRISLILHETWHVIHEDPIRMAKASHPKIMNAAQDYYINQRLVDGGFPLGEGWLFDSKYQGMTIQQIYNKLLQDGQDGESSGSGNPLAGDVAPSEGQTPEQKATQHKIQEIISKAAMQAEMAKQAGTIPEDIARRIEEIRNPKLAWHQILERYMHDRVHDEYSWARRNRRYSDIYLPSLWNEGMGEIRCYIDCSGSISQQELALEVKEMIYIKEISNPALMTLKAFSHDLGREQAFERDEDIQFDADVSGGTSLRPVWRDIQQNQDTEVAVIFTDGWVDVPPIDDLACDVVFVIVENSNWDHPDATVIHMELPRD